MATNRDPPLSISIVSQDSIVVLSLVGELDAASVSDLRAHFDDLSSRDAADVVIDVARLEFIDSSGLNALAVGARTTKSNGGSLVVAGPSEHLKQVFEIVDLGSELEVEPTVEDAVQKLRTAGSDPLVDQ